MDQDTLTQELRVWKSRLDRGEITESVYERAVERLLDSAGYVVPSADTPRHYTVLDDLNPGMEIGPEDNRFRLVRKIGGGGMGRVWLARDLGEEAIEGGERYKALKVVSPLLQDSPRALESLKREAARASKLSHPNVINVYGWRQGRDGWLFVVMDYLQGRDLDQLLEEEGNLGLSWARTLPLLWPMAAALDYAHQEYRLIHRDLKPGNVFITEQGVVKLLDFGLAYRLRRSSSLINVKESHNRGTPQYMPPEAHIGGEPDSAAQDIYALACLIYEMLTGHPPYSHEAAIERSPELLPNPPKELTRAAWEILKQGFAYHKEYRPGSAGELVERLIAAQTDASFRKRRKTTTAPTSSVATPRQTQRRLVLGLLLVALGGGYVWLQQRPEALADLAARFALWRLDHSTAPATAAAVTRIFQDSLKDGTPGPVMVQVPPGEFLMGSPADEAGRGTDEQQHTVRFTQPVILSQHEVTFADYDRYADASGRERPGDNGWGRGRRPVINVSWQDAQGYADWLSEQTGQRYRLPTEAEWEYAARAGALTPYHVGATLHTRAANYNGSADPEAADGERFRGKTLAVGQFPANAWSFHDMHGNVWEWTCSLYDATYAGAEQTCADPENAGQRVSRGGSWTNLPRALRAAYRVGYPATAQYNFLGFRLAREP